MHSTATLASLVFVGSVITATFAGCSSDTCLDQAGGCYAADGGAVTEGSTDGPSPIDAPPGCDLAKEPKDSPACVDDAVGVFADATNGSDTNPGTKASPFKTLATAITKTGNKPRVYVCDGTYDDTVKLSSPNAPSLFGGFACGSWSYASTKPKVAPNSAGYALEVDGVTNDLIVSDLAFASREGAAKGASSIAAFVHGSTKVTFVRAAIDAAAGREGDEGLQGTTGTLTAVSAGSLDGNGNPAAGAVAGTQKVCTCSSGGTSTGAAGGGPNGMGAPGFPGLGGAAPNDGLGGMGGTNCGAGGLGHTGADAAPAADAPALAANAFGTLTPTGWTPRGGATGTNGSPGQGGGGGGGRDGTSAGGGGACGGCGGTGGKGATGGGASIALLVLDSTVIVRASSLTTKAAGTGGKGGLGGGGGAGGTMGGPGNCTGGEGGKGGDGGSGGGGAGGLSVGVLYKGTKPALESTTVTPGAFGPKGQGGKPGSNDGIDGKAAESLEVP